MANAKKVELSAAQIGQAVQSGGRLFGAFKASHGANNRAWAVIREVSHEVSDIVTWNAALKQFKELAKAAGIDPAGSTFNQYVSSVSSGIREGILPEQDEPVAMYRKRVKDAKGPTNRAENKKDAPTAESKEATDDGTVGAVAKELAAAKADNSARGLLLQSIIRDLQQLSDADLLAIRDYAAELYVRSIDANDDVAGEELSDDEVISELSELMPKDEAIAA